MKIRAYGLIYTPTTDYLTQSVALAISNGWQPLGGPTAGPEAWGGVIIQAVVKYED
jgi:hypothetical protein